MAESADAKAIAFRRLTRAMGTRETEKENGNPAAMKRYLHPRYASEQRRHAKNAGVDYERVENFDTKP